MQLEIQVFEPRLEQNDLFQDTVTLNFEPNSLKAFSKVSGMLGVNKNFFDVTVDISRREILNKYQKIEFEAIDGSLGRKVIQKISLREMMELSDIESCMKVFLNGKLDGEYTYSDEALTIISYLEEQNKFHLIDKALEECDEAQFWELTASLLLKST